MCVYSLVVRNGRENPSLCPYSHFDTITSLTDSSCAPGTLYSVLWDLVACFFRNGIICSHGAEGISFMNHRRDILLMCLIPYFDTATRGHTNMKISSLKGVYFFLFISPTTPPPLPPTPSPPSSFPLSPPLHPIPQIPPPFSTTPPSSFLFSSSPPSLLLLFLLFFSSPITQS